MSRTSARLVYLLALATLAAAGCSSSSKSASSTTTAAATATSAAGSGGGACTATATAQPGTQHITVTPVDGLTDGQKVHVTGTGFSGCDQLGINECADKGNDTGAGDCDLGRIVLVKSDPAGKVAGDYTVHKGPFGANQITCGAAQKCLVSVSELKSGQTENDSQGITFAS